ncbi:MAG: T9SS type A sorting domain-containing protein [Ignavibacteriales bacterium]|nr:T9SS type A sorting domain-containing protein [Ignavibacteriales bacterium]
MRTKFQFCIFLFLIFSFIFYVSENSYAKNKDQKIKIKISKNEYKTFSSKAEYEEALKNGLKPYKESNNALLKSRAGNQPSVCQMLIPYDGSSFTQAMGRNDDGSSAEIPLQFDFSFFGTTFNSVYINNNGNISFGEHYGSYDPEGLPSPDYVMILPFWADVDTENPLSGLVYYKSEAHRFTVIWNGVGYYSENADKLNTFEVIISDGTDPIVGIGKNVAFSYGDMQWTTGDASDGVDGFGGTAAAVGVNRGDGVFYFQVGRFDHPGFDYDGAFGENDGVDYLDGKNSTCLSNTSFVFNASGAGIFVTSPAGNEVWHAGDPQDITWISTNMSGDRAVQNNSNPLQKVNGGAANFVKIEYSTNGGLFWIPITQQTEDNGSFSWIVPSTPSENCFVRVSQFGNPAIFDINDSPFTIFSDTPPAPDFVEVWPGDLNNDGIVDRNDIQTYYGNAGKTGPVREVQSNRWGAYQAPVWEPIENTYLDANGDGVVNGRDLASVRMNWGKTHTILSKSVVKVEEYNLDQNYPNPFNPTTVVEYELPENSIVNIKVYDLLGREVATLVEGEVESGMQIAEWKPENLSSGMYIYRMTAKSIESAKTFTMIKKMQYLR